MFENYIRIYLILSLLTATTYMAGQEDFSTLYKAKDPSPTDINHDQRRIIHQQFLDSVSATNDTTAIILGNFYLANDYVIGSSYDKAMHHLIKVEELASKSNNTLILGRASHKKGTVYSLVENNKVAITEYEKALQLNSLAQDSQFIAITLEQLGALYGYEEAYDKSAAYYERAIPMVKRHCEPKSLSTTLSNYGNTLLQQDLFQEAISVYKEAVAIGEEINDPYRVIPAKQNLALAYLNIESYDLALNIYHQCKAINEKESWLDFLIHSYEGLAIVHEELGHTDSSLYYYKKFHILNDSLFGVESQARINTLVGESEAQKQKEEILKKTNQITNGRQRLSRVMWVSGTLIGVSILFICFLTKKKRKADQQLKESHKALLSLTKALQVKNAEIRDASPESHDKAYDEQALEELDILNTKILTDDDWSAFKALFAKAYPRYLQKIREHFDSISEAEERLFLFIKLNLTSRESADILGIKPETIKKTRTRLRKRLKLDRETNLDDFIKSF